MLIKMTKSGYTLLEILTTLILIGVLAAFALPNFTISIERSRASEGEQIVLALYGAQQRYQIDTGSFTSNISNLDVSISHNSQNFNAPTVSNVDPIAQIVRAGNLYTIRVNQNGAVSCTGAGTICTKMGY